MFMKKKSITVYAVIMLVGTLLLVSAGERKFAALFLSTTFLVAIIHTIIDAITNRRIYMRDRFGSTKTFTRDKYPRSYWFFIFVHCCIALVCLGSIYFQIAE
jgi:uncharacterized membrane protein YozB (DUF420 family)